MPHQFTAQMIAAASHEPIASSQAGSPTADAAILACIEQAEKSAAITHLQAFCLRWTLWAPNRPGPTTTDPRDWLFQIREATTRTITLGGPTPN